MEPPGVWDALLDSCSPCVHWTQMGASMKTEETMACLSLHKPHLATAMICLAASKTIPRGIDFAPRAYRPKPTQTSRSMSWPGDVVVLRVQDVGASLAEPSSVDHSRYPLPSEISRPICLKAPRGAQASTGGSGRYVHPVIQILFRCRLRAKCK